MEGEQAMKQSVLFLALLLATSSCGAAALPTGSAAARTLQAPALVEGLRGRRYCEILAGGRSGFHAHLDVYTTVGLNDCPEPRRPR